MHNFKIEKNVPMPSKFGDKAKWLSLAKEINVGDSFVVDDAAEKERVRCCLKNYGVRIATRSILDGDKVTGYRLWCVNKREII